MQIILLMALLLLCMAREPYDYLFEDIEHHDEFNLADVDGVGFDRLEQEMRKRKIPLPKSMQR
jgi:hypothetical protein